jgi:hypothetical protein
MVWLEDCWSCFWDYQEMDECLKISEKELHVQHTVFKYSSSPRVKLPQSPRFDKAWLSWLCSGDILSILCRGAATSVAILTISAHHSCSTANTSARIWVWGVNCVILKVSLHGYTTSMKLRGAIALRYLSEGRWFWCPKCEMVDRALQPWRSIVALLRWEIRQKFGGCDTWNCRPGQPWHWNRDLQGDLIPVPSRKPRQPIGNLEQG